MSSANAPNNQIPVDDNIDVLQVIRRLEQRIQELETANSEQTGKVVFKNPRATTLKLYDDLLERYPAISEPNFFKAKLPKDHDAFDWNDFHYTEGMEYKAPSVLEHSEVSLAPAAKLHDADLSAIQGYIAMSTRFFDTFAHEIINSGDADTDLGIRTLGFLNTVRISAANDAANISCMREKLYYDALGIKQGHSKEKSLLSLEELAAAKAAAEMVRSTYKKPEPREIKTKQPENKHGKNKSGSSGKTKDRQPIRNRSEDKSSHKSDKKSGNKPNYKSSSKSGGGSYRKRQEQGNEEEESD